MFYLCDIDFGLKYFFSNKQLKKIGFEIKHVLYMCNKNSAALK